MQGAGFVQFDLPVGDQDHHFLRPRVAGQMTQEAQCAVV